MAIEKKSLINKSVPTTKSTSKAAPSTTTAPSPKLQTAVLMAKQIKLAKVMLAKKATLAKVMY